MFARAFLLSKQLLAFSLGGFSLLLAACSDNNVETNSSEDTQIHQAYITEISPQNSYTIEREYIGQVISKQLTDLSFEYAGQVIEVLADSGDTVAKGDVLAKQNTKLLKIKEAETLAEIKQNQAQLTLNQSNLKRANALIKDGYTSEQSVDELTTEQQVIKAGLKRLDSSLASVRYQIEKSALIAPFDGTISQRMLSEGAVASPNAPAFKFIKANDTEITLGVPPGVAASLSVTQAVQLKLANKKLSATVLAIGQQVDINNRTVNIRLLPSEPIKFFNGELVRVALTQEIDEAGFWLPISALTDGIRGQWNIYQAKPEQENFTLERATIKVLYTNTTKAFIKGLPLENHMIVTAGLHRLVPGQRVKGTIENNDGEPK